MKDPPPMLLPKNWHTLALDQKFAYALALAQERRDARKPECRKTAVVSKAGKILKPATIACGSTCRQPKNCGLSKAEKQRIQSRVGTDPDALRRAIVVAKRKKRQGQSGTGAVYEATKEALGAAGQARNEKRKARGEKVPKSGPQPQPEPIPVSPGKPALRPRPASEWEQIDQPVSISELRDIRKRIYDGTINADEIKHQYARFKASEDALRQELGKMTLKDLGREFPYFYKVKKDRHINHALTQLGIGFNPRNSISYSPMDGPNAYQKALDRAVESWTDDDVLQRVQSAMDEDAEEQRIVEALKNPKTLEDFRNLASRVGLGNLTPEQRRTYEDLYTEDRREARKRQRLQQKGTVKGVRDWETGEKPKVAVKQVKHSKTGETLHIAQMGDRVGPEQFQAMKTRAKQMGGFYDRYSKGFRFPSEEIAQRFASMESVDQTSEVAEAQQGRQMSAAESIKTKAEAIRGKAQATLDQDRKTNTARRARMTGYIHERARAELELADTMDNVAAAIESGRAKFLDGMRNRSQFEAMEDLLNEGHYKSKKGRYQELRIDDESIDEVKFPYPEIEPRMVSDLEKAAKEPGMSKYANRLLKKLKKSKSDEWISLTDPDDIEAARAVAKLDALKYSSLGGRVDKYQRIMAMDITNAAELRSAMREYVAFRGKERKADPVKEMEMALVGQKVGVDFFPTPKRLAAQMAEDLELEPGMKVLEPSAGSGYLAEAVRDLLEGNVDLTTVEMSHTLGELLRAKGFNPEQMDFLEFNEGKGEYDRIIMNPPFGGGADIDHVRHAYNLLKPGGKMVAIMSEGPFFRSGKKDQGFRDWLDEIGGESEKLPEGTFKESDVATGVNTRKVIITKPFSRQDSQGLSPIVHGYGLNPNPFYKPLWVAMGLQQW